MPRQSPSERPISSAITRSMIGAAAAPADVPSVARLLEATRLGGTIWTRDVLAVYAAAARVNNLLCSGLLLPLGSMTPRACGT